MSAKHKRNAVLRKTEDKAVVRALDVASRIKSPWQRGWALAEVARNAPWEDQLHVAELALRIAKEGRDAYQQVMIAAGIFQHFYRSSFTTKHFAMVLSNAQSVEPPPSKVEALFQLWLAVWTEAELEQLVRSSLVQVCSTANTWRAGRAMETVLRIVAYEREDRALAEELWERMPENRYKRKARRRLDFGPFCDYH